MKKNYFFTFFFSAIVICLMLSATWANAQEPKVFTIKDFDLLGKVKSCEVITDYGKEAFEFDEAGVLTKVVTQYNDKDYDITYYKYQGTELAERRDEIYRDGVFDKSTSIAHLYELDTLGRKKITERIVSYNEEFLDMYEYHYNLDNQLIKIIRSNNDGLDETRIEYTEYKDEKTTSHYLNNVLQKSIRISKKKQKSGESLRVELIKEYLEGQPSRALENKYNAKNNLISQEHFNYDSKKKSFAPYRTTSYKYDNNGMQIAEFIKVNETMEEREFIYQYDNGESGNWVKKIVTPENSYTTRKIEYYPEEAVDIED